MQDVIRTRLAQLFDTDDRNEPMDAVVRRFWSRGPRGALYARTARTPATEGPVGGATPSPGGSVVDLAAWARARAAR